MIDKKLTQADVNGMVLSEIEMWNGGYVDLDVIASDVYALIQRMLRHGTISEAHDAETMIDDAIEFITDRTDV